MYRELPTERVSVVIPVRNDRDYLERCLDALALQTYAPFEVIVVDNGSTDGAASIAAQRGAHIVHESELGIPAASAAGYDAARGDLIARLDADSIPGVTWVASVCEAFARHSNAAAITGSGMLMDDDGTPHRRSSRFFMRSYFGLVGLALGHPPLWGSALAMRRAAWLEVRDEVCRHDQKMHDDMDLSIHLGPRFEIVLDRTLTVPVSSRPLTFDLSAVVRFARGFYTILRHWPREFPPVRMLRRARAHRTVEALQTA
ncbi:glycosyltransferase family A protein [Microcella sp.]|uniref:glycosyltransferase family A protein n=1 Tax=Microcella sp. TaxID=1913979 RepID=UPI00255E7C98|nr:glycosyltransferase family 2 protein [Microcella sp.]MBX9472225.1 glycosyltransferase family 2 protein [Microcella sp.]